MPIKLKQSFSISREAFVELDRKRKARVSPEVLNMAVEMSRKIKPYLPPADLRELIELCHRGDFGRVPMSARLRVGLETISRLAVLRNGQRGRAQVEKSLADYAPRADNRSLGERAQEMSAKLDAIHFGRA